MIQHTALVVNEGQIKTLQTAITEPFLQKICAIIRRTLKQRVKEIDDAQLFEKVKKEYEASQSFHINTQRGIARFISLSFILGPFYYSKPAFRSVFNKDNRNIDKDIDILFQKISDNLKKTSSK